MFLPVDSTTLSSIASSILMHATVVRLESSAMMHFPTELSQRAAHQSSQLGLTNMTERVDNYAIFTACVQFQGILYKLAADH